VDLLVAELGAIRRYLERAAIANPVRHFRYYADLIEAATEGDLRTAGAAQSMVVLEPIGVVAAITPWNGPVASATLKIVPALAAGCSVVLKPPPETPLAVSLLADVLAEAGLPEGVFSLLIGGREVGEHLVAHPDVDKVAFTGSTAAGRRIMSVCAERIARVTLELGGKSAAIVLDDADVDETVQGLLPMTTLVNGQACFSQTRILVPEHRRSELEDAFAAAYASLKVGDPDDRSTDLGPLASKVQRDRVEGYVSVARDAGCRVLGGGRPEAYRAGYFVNPTVLTDVTNDMRVAQEEIFGPVVALLPYASEDAAVIIANDSIYGLSGSVWSRDTVRALAVAREMRTGGVSINGAPQAFDAPFGGFKQSGIGREMGPEGLRSYQEQKSIALPGS
jgi:aldehyde dehydrogenase (NAD+)